jgi:small subunit ribosomal protein S8
MTDPIADMLTRIRNAHAIHMGTVVMPHSKLKEAILKTLKTEGYIQEFTVTEGKPFKTLTVTLKYTGTEPAITELKRLSTPGRRLYMRASDLASPLGGYGIIILSTNQGVMTNKEAKKHQLGGEVICQVW